MDALRKQASKLRVKVSKKQQAVRKQLSGSGYERYDYVVIEEVELQRHQQLEKLYRTTRAGREFQKDIGGAAEALTAIGYKHIEAETKLSEDCCSYGTENDSDTMLAKAVAIYGDACKNVEKETEDLNQLLSLQVLEPLRAMITAGPLEDAWHLAQRYSRMRQEAEGQAAELSKRQARVRESPVPDNVAKWQAAEAKMQELKANMAVLGKEASAALAAKRSTATKTDISAACFSGSYLLQLFRLNFSPETSCYFSVLNLLMYAMVRLKVKRIITCESVLYSVKSKLRLVNLLMVSDKQQKDSAPPVIPTSVTPSQTGSEKTTYFLAEVSFHFSLTLQMSIVQ
ncbi:SH3 domain-containing protein 3 [Linum grandiflorum]